MITYPSVCIDNFKFAAFYVEGADAVSTASPIDNGEETKKLNQKRSNLLIHLSNWHFTVTNNVDPIFK